MRRIVTKSALIALLALVVVAGSVSTSFGAELTLDDCIEHALKTRSSIISARGQEVRASANKMAALGAFLPRVSASYQYSKSDRTDIESEVPNLSGGTIVVMQDDQETTSKYTSLSASMWLFDLPTVFNYFGAGSDKVKAKLDVINSEQSLILAVKASYYAYLASEQNVEVQQEAVKRSEEAFKLIESKYELGSANLSDVLKQKVQFGNDRLSLLSAQNAVTDTKSGLAYTIGVDPSSDVEFSTEYNVREYTGSMTEAINFGLTHEPGLLSAEQAVKSANIAVKSRTSEYLPSLSGSFTYGISDGTQGDTVIFNFSSKSKTVGIQLSWNIFDGFSRERNISSAKVGRNNARALFADTKNLVSREIVTTYLDIEKLKEQKLVSQENVDASQEDMKITQEKYNLGAATILDLLNAQVSLKQALVTLVRADFDLNLAIARLENAMGKM